MKLINNLPYPSNLKLLDFIKNNDGKNQLSKTVWQLGREK